jgi:hypothetical protein
MFDPAGLKPHVVNWPEVAEGLIQRVHREAVGGITDDATHRLLTEVLGYAEVPARWAALDPTRALEPIVPVTFAKSGLQFRYFSTVTTIGTPQDITLQELRVESFFPADAATGHQAAEFRSARTPGRASARDRRKAR